MCRLIAPIHVLLVVYFVCTCSHFRVHGIGAKDCQQLINNTCVTTATFRYWNNARAFCASLGGDLTIPTPDSHDLQEAVTLTGSDVWVGGRVSWKWSRDDTYSYKIANWNGCTANDISTDLNFTESHDLSECIQSCSRFKYTYVKRSHCGCSNKEYDTDSCDDDPYGWTIDAIPGENIHQFDNAYFDSVKEDHCAAVTVPYIGGSFDVYWKTCSKSYKSLCQSSGNNSTADPENDMLYEQRKLKWEEAEQNCRENGRSLVKLIWVSPLFAKTGYDEFGYSYVWIGAYKIEWRFLDGNLVTSVWTDFEPEMEDGCLVLGEYGLRTMTCKPYWNPLSSYPPAACTLIPEEKPPTASNPTHTDVSVSTPPGSTPTGVTVSSNGSTPARPGHTETEGSTEVRPGQTPTDAVTEKAENVTKMMTGGVTSAMGDSPSEAIYIGVGTSVGVLAVLGIALAVVWRMRKRRRTEKPTRPHSPIMYRNSLYEASDTPGVRISEQGEITTETASPLGNTADNVSNMSVSDLYSVPVKKKNPQDPGAPISGGVINMAACGSEGNTVPLLDVTRADDQYDRLALSKVTSENMSPCDVVESPVYSNVSPGDNTYMNCGNPAVTSPYDHVITRGRPGGSDNKDYDHLDIPNVARDLEVDTSSVYNHVTGEEDV